MPRHLQFGLACCTVLVCCFLQQQVVGDDPAAAPDPLPVVAISTIPQPEPDPPLKYSLTPTYSEVQEGNAATWYYRAILLIPREKEKRFGDEQTAWIALPIEQFPQDKAREWLEPYRNSLRELKTATYRDHSNWNQGIRHMKGTEALSFLLPELQEMRELARVLQIKSRLEIAQGQFEDARDTLTMGYQMAANLSKSPILISELVAVAVANTMNQSVVDWINADGPNLYWALASLPRPLVDTRLALQQEMNLPLQVFPYLSDPESISYTPQQWRQVIGESIPEFSAITSNHPASTSNLMAQTMATGIILAGYSSAKQALIDSGMDAKQVEAMPVGQVIAIRTARVYRKVYHESLKWTLLPYWQSYRQMQTSFQTLRDEGYLEPYGRTSGVLPIASVFLPAIEPAILAPTRMQRDIAVLQTIEALRMAAAEVGGKWPNALSELQQCPAPLDPITGASFIYKVEHGKAVLELPPPEGKPADTFGKRYEVSLGAQQ